MAGPVDPLALRMWFESVDTDRSGRISALELRSALAMGALHYSTEDCEAMIKAFGNGQRGLDLDGFSRLHTFLGGVRQSFEYFDQDRSGTLQPHELKMAMAQAGYNVPAEVVAAVCKRYDLESRGGLTVSQYVRSCLFLHSVHQIFYSFDTQRTGSCTFKIDSFLYACAHIV